MKLKGHETFILREGWLNKGLQAVTADPKVFSQNYGADALGVGSNMAKAIRYWLKAGGFTQEGQKTGAKLTQIAQIIVAHDRYMEDDFGLWIFHANLARNVDNATSWYLTFNEVEAEEFTHEELFDLLKTKLLQMPGVDKISERSLKDDVAVLLNMYVRENVTDYDPEDKKLSPFASLGLMKRTGNHYRRMQPQQSEKLERVFFYLLQSCFQEKKRDSISIDDVANGACLPGRILNLGRVAVNEILDSLAAQQKIIVNRTAGLDMVYRNSSDTLVDIVRGYYEE